MDHPVRKFDLMDRVLVTDGSLVGKTGYINGSEVRDGVLSYWVTLDDREALVPEAWLERVGPL